MCWNYLRRYWINIFLCVVLVYGPYTVLRQKIDENKKIQERLAKIKPTVPPDLYEEITQLKLKLSKAEFRSSLLNFKFQNLNEKIQKLEDAESKNVDLSLPAIFRYLPHLKNQLFQPSYVISNGKGFFGVAYGVGINKLLQFERLLTLIDSLFKNKGKKVDWVLIVYVNINRQDNKEVVDKINNQFKDELEKGFIDIIVPPMNYYPDFKSVKGTFDDTNKTTIENSKTNLDNVFLMMYAEKKAPFYVQLSTSLIAKPHFDYKIQNFALKKSSTNVTWIELSFSMDGCFGKLYRTKELKRLIPFILEFYDIKPCNWLLFGFIGTLVCHLEKNDCVERIKSKRKQFRPVLFKSIYNGDKT